MGQGRAIQRFYNKPNEQKEEPLVNATAIHHAATMDEVAIDEHPYSVPCEYK